MSIPVVVIIEGCYQQTTISVGFLNCALEKEGDMSQKSAADIFI